MPAQRVQWPVECNEVARDEPGPLVNELIERMLAVRSRLAPVNWASLIINFGPVQCDVLAVALHRQLLEVCGKALQVLLVRQYCNGFGAKEIGVPHSQKTHEYG